MSSEAILEESFKKAAGAVKEAMSSAMDFQTDLFEEAIGKAIDGAALCPICAASFKVSLDATLREVNAKRFAQKV